MGRSVGPIVAAALALGACATPPEWSERVTVAVDRGGRGFAAFSVSGLSSPPMLARCLAPGSGDGPRLALVDRGACENDFRKLGNSRVKLSREREETR